jgi:hypothetical protein
VPLVLPALFSRREGAPAQPRDSPGAKRRGNKLLLSFLDINSDSKINIFQKNIGINDGRRDRNKIANFALVEWMITLKDQLHTARL